jgi:predicted RNase H-like HicB family nuclease
MESAAVIKNTGKWWIGWIEEVPGANCQGRSRDELLETLRATLREAVEFNRQEVPASAGGDSQELKNAV